LLAEFQSAGTVHDVPETIKIWVTSREPQERSLRQ
jgi:hypothetical protein